MIVKAYRCGCECETTSCWMDDRKEVLFYLLSLCLKSAKLMMFPPFEPSVFDYYYYDTSDTANATLMLF